MLCAATHWVPFFCWPSPHAVAFLSRSSHCAWSHVFRSSSIRVERARLKVTQPASSSTTRPNRFVSLSRILSIAPCLTSGAHSGGTQKGHNPVTEKIPLIPNTPLFPLTELTTSSNSVLQSPCYICPTIRNYGVRSNSI